MGMETEPSPMRYVHHKFLGPMFSAKALFADILLAVCTSPLSVPEAPSSCAQHIANRTSLPSLSPYPTMLFLSSLPPMAPSDTETSKRQRATKRDLTNGSGDDASIGRTKTETSHEVKNY